MTPTFSDRARLRRPRLYEEIARQVMDFILDHDIQVGARLPAEGEIARSLGVSRPAVREAVVALETAGIVVARSGGGLFVLRRPRRGATLPWARRGDPGPGPREQLRARQLVEPEIAAEAARKATDEQIAMLDQLARAVSAAANAGLPFADDAVEFHLLLAQAAGNAPLAEMMGRLLDSSQHDMWRVLRRRSESSPTASGRTGLRERLVAALRARDPYRARRLMQRHLAEAEAASFGEQAEPPPAARSPRRSGGSV